MHSRARPLWSGLNGDLKSRLGAAGIRCKRPQWVERPPSRLFGRLPPCIPSRLRLAGIRKPLTRAELPILHGALSRVRLPCTSARGARSIEAGPERRVRAA